MALSADFGDTAISLLTWIFNVLLSMGLVRWLLKPSQCVFIFGFREVFDHCMHQMGGDLWHFCQKTAIAHYGQSSDLAVMALDEPHMCQKCLEIYQPGKVFA